MLQEQNIIPNIKNLESETETINNTLDSDQISHIGNHILDSAGVVLDQEPIAETEEIKNLNYLRDFFNIDQSIQKEMFRLAPPHYTDPNYGDGLNYDNKVSKGLKSLDSQFDGLTQKLIQLGIRIDIDGFTEKKKMLIEKFKTDIEDSKFDFSKLADSCKNDVADMNPDFIQAVSTEIIGYYLWKDTGKIISQAKTLNELLHVAHMCVQSDESFYEKLPKWSEVKEGGIEYDAYGEQTERSKEIFDNVASALKADRLDVLGNKISPTTTMQIFSLDNKVQLLVRDSGHALSVEVDTSHPTSAIIRYNIPKPINIDIVNTLPGVRKIKDSDSRTGTGGSFEVPYDNLGRDIADFILKIPTDVMTRR